MLPHLGRILHPTVHVAQSVLQPAQTQVAAMQPPTAMADVATRAMGTARLLVTHHVGNLAQAQRQGAAVVPGVRLEQQLACNHRRQASATAPPPTTFLPLPFCSTAIDYTATTRPQAQIVGCTMTIQRVCDSQSHLGYLSRDSVRCLGNAVDNLQRFSSVDHESFEREADGAVNEGYDSAAAVSRAQAAVRRSQYSQRSSSRTLGLRADFYTRGAFCAHLLPGSHEISVTPEFLIRVSCVTGTGTIYCYYCSYYCCYYCFCLLDVQLQLMSILTSLRTYMQRIGKWPAYSATVLSCTVALRS